MLPTQQLRTCCPYAPVGLAPTRETLLLALLHQGDMMAGQPSHPDEDDLARFHNGDTLDNIPVVRLPAQATSSKRRRHWRHAPVVLVPVMAIVGTLAGIGVAALMDGPTEPPAAAAGAPHRTTAAVTAPTATASTQSAVRHSVGRTVRSCPRR